MGESGVAPASDFLTASALLTNLAAGSTKAALTAAITSSLGSMRIVASSSGLTVIIQNLSLRVPGRAALVDGTNWQVPRALLAVKDQALALRLQNFLRSLPN